MYMLPFSIHHSILIYFSLFELIIGIYKKNVISISLILSIKMYCSVKILWNVIQGSSRVVLNGN